MAIRRVYPARCLILARVPSREDTAGIHRATNPAYRDATFAIHPRMSADEMLARAAASCLPRDRYDTAITSFTIEACTPYAYARKRKLPMAARIVPIVERPEVSES